MATYAIGDIQGCYEPLLNLLELIHFDPTKDTLWFTGDLINRSPQSLEALRFIRDLGDRHRIVLGNHDLHLLAVANGQHPGWAEDTFESILTAPDRSDLLNWLIQKPLIHHDSELGYTLIHAGLAPSWDLTKALSLAKEVETVLKSSQATNFFKFMYGNEPICWSDTLSGWDRLRCITNFFTRARFCDDKGCLELNKKGKLNQEKDLLPWFQFPSRKTQHDKIIFGHWAALAGVTNTPHCYAIDTGCVWGFKLTAMRLEDEKRFTVPCSSSLKLKK